MNPFALLVLIAIDLVVLSFAHDLQFMVLGLAGFITIPLIIALKILPCHFLFKDKIKNPFIMLLPLLLDIILGLVVVYIIKNAQGDINGNIITMHYSTSGSVTKMNLMPDGIFNLLFPITIVSFILNFITWIITGIQQVKIAAQKQNTKNIKF